jgi:tetratricopeptide (TPR) repeat protein
MKDAVFLLVTNDSDIAGALKEILNQLGYEKVRWHDSATDAWATLKTGEIGCVFASWEIAEMSGLALLKIVRNEPGWHDLPFFLMDSAFTKVKIIQAGQVGVNGLIVQPFDVENISNKIKTLFASKPEPAFVEVEKKIEAGLQMIDTQNYGEALELFSRLINNGEKAEYYYNIGYIKAAQEKYEEAIAAFRKATQLNQLFARAYEAMGKVYHILGHDEAAEKALQKAADIYMSKDKNENAEEVLNEILEINPNTINVYNSLGVLHRRKGDLPTALQYYKKALLVHPREPNIHYNIGRLYIGMQQLAKAKSHFDKAVRLNPTFEEGKKALKALENTPSLRPT